VPWTKFEKSMVSGPGKGNENIKDFVF
jgi:hypothetical protein